MKLKAFTEEYYDSVNVPTMSADKTVEIYKNPTQKDIENIRKNMSGVAKRTNMVRFIVDRKNKDLYVFSSDATHKIVRGRMGRDAGLEVGDLGYASIKDDELSSPMEIPDWARKYIKDTSLKEEWKDSIKVDDETYEIFINPTKRELLDLRKETDYVRFIIDVKKMEILVWNADLFHKNVSDKFELPYNYPKATKDYIYGEGGIVSSGSNKILVYKTIGLVEDKKKVKKGKLLKYFMVFK